MSAANDKPGFSEWPLRYVARVTLQLRLPAVIHAGRDADSPRGDFVRDPNGLPTLPGTSLAGILRHACTENDMPGAAIDSLFGVSADDEGSASRLSVSWGHIHDFVDRPVDGLLAPGDARFKCPVLTEARVGALRQRVRISVFGASHGRGKFEEAVVCAGHRFTFDLMLRGDEDDEPAWQRLLGLLHDPDLRLVAGSRRGFGAFKVHRLLTDVFDLRTSEGFGRFCALPTRLDEPAALPAIERDGRTRGPRIAVTLRGLHPATPWLFGGGKPQGDEGIAPVTETVIRWDNDHGAPSPQQLYYLPATGLKGAIAHRLAWHFNRIAGRRVQDGKGFESIAPNEAVTCLLGYMAGDQGRRGRLLFDDLMLAEPVASQEVPHVSLDRFSGGVRSGLLFSERVLAPQMMQTDYRVVVVPPSGEPVSENIRRAFAAVLEDIRKGRLAVGSGAARGNGRFQCDSVVWDDGGHWLATGAVGNRGAGA